MISGLLLGDRLPGAVQRKAIGFDAGSTTPGPEKFPKIRGSPEHPGAKPVSRTMSE
jgi:hypothetical protein